MPESSEGGRPETPEEENDRLRAENEDLRTKKQVAETSGETRTRFASLDGASRFFDGNAPRLKYLDGGHTRDENGVCACGQPHHNTLKE